MTRAALYLRVSTADQAERSIPAQEAACRAWCEQHGMTVVQVYKDEGRSAWSGKERPAYEQAKADAEQGAFGVLVVDSYDRLSRGADQESILGACWQFKAVGVEVESASEHTPADAALASMLRLMHSITANQESERKSARSKRGAEARAATGKHHGRPPFGYRIGPNGMEPDPVTGPFARGLFEDFDAGVTQAELARRLEARGVPSVSGGRWVQGTVRGILKNPVYCGRVPFKGDVIEGQHEAIVPVELWERCQARISTRGQRQTRGRDAQAHLLSRLVRCGLCGETMLSRRGEARATGGRYETYVCPTAAGKVDGWCEQRPVPREVLDRAVIEHFTRTVIDVEATRAEWAKRYGAAVSRAESELAAAEAVLTAKSGAVDRTLRDYLDGKLDADAWSQVKAVVEPERDAARAAVEAAQERLEAARRVPEPDIEARVAERLTELHRAVGEGLQDANTVAALRAQLASVFESFTVLPDVLPDTVEDRDQEPEASDWIETAEPGSTGWTVSPELRAEAIVGDVSTFEHGFRPIARKIPLGVGFSECDTLRSNKVNGLATPYLWPAFHARRA